jgi:hypothetical protein
MRLAIGIVGVLVLAAPEARAEVDNIGNAGQIVIGAERLAGVFVDKPETEVSQTQAGVTRTERQEISLTTVSVFGNEPSGPSAIPRLALDVLPIQGLSLGGSLMYVTRSGDSKLTLTSNNAALGTTQESDLGTDTVFVIAPRVGYAYAFDETFAIWPRVGFSYASLVNESKNDTTDANGNTITITRTTTLKQTNLTLEALLVVSPFSHFAFAGGPFYDVGLGGSVEFETDDPNATPPTLDGDYKTSAFGFTVGILAYF